MYRLCTSRISVIVVVALVQNLNTALNPAPTASDSDAAAADDAGSGDADSADADAGSDGAGADYAASDASGPAPAAADAAADTPDTDPGARPVCTRPAVGTAAADPLGTAGVARARRRSAVVAGGRAATCAVVAAAAVVVAAAAVGGEGVAGTCGVVWGLRLGSRAGGCFSVPTRSG
ncbi:hypothetical protein V498_08270, partial [Pseudogymnoascus sp. VKM F-4517 (FW-2822)]